MLLQCASAPLNSIVFFFQAEDGIRDGHVTGVQTCALPISELWAEPSLQSTPVFGSSRTRNLDESIIVRLTVPGWVLLFHVGPASRAPSSQCGSKPRSRTASSA